MTQEDSPMADDLVSISELPCCPEVSREPCCEKRSNTAHAVSPCTNDYLGGIPQHFGNNALDS